MKSLPSHKGCGPDLLSAEFFESEWNVWSLCIADVCGWMHLEEKWPPQWKRGRQIDLSKGNGNVQDCEASRGLLLAVHMNKIPANDFEKKKSATRIIVPTFLPLRLVLYQAAERRGSSN